MPKLNIFQTVHFSRVLLLIIPLIIFAVALHMVGISGPFFIRSVDPDYVYLFNGLLIGNLNFNVPHIDHPGTPIQVAVAITSRVAHLFIGKEDYLTDVMSNPEKYLRITIITLNTLMVGLTYIVGLKLYKLTHNLILPLLIQSTPLIAISPIIGLARLIPDPYIWLSISFLIYMLLKYYFDEDSAKRIKYYSTRLGLLCGLCLSFKFTAISYFLIPLIILPGYKNKLRFTLFGLLSFPLFAFPTLYNLNFIYHWVKDILVHKGRYGKGETGLVDSTSFIENFKTLISSYYELSYVLLISIAVLIAFAIYKRFKNDKLLIMLSGSILAAIFQYIIVSKHFAVHYMMPILAIIPLLIVLWSEVVDVLFKRHVKQWILVCALAIISINSIKNYRANYPWVKERGTKKFEVYNLTKTIVGNDKLIILCLPYGSYFKEQGLEFGIAYTGRFKADFRGPLQDLHSKVYIYSLNEVFTQAGYYVTPEDVLGPNDTAYLFVAANMKNKMEDLINLFPIKINIEEVRSNMHKGESLYKLTTNE